MLLAPGAEGIIDGGRRKDGSYAKGSSKELVAFAGDGVKDGGIESSHGDSDGETDGGGWGGGFYFHPLKREHYESFWREDMFSPGIRPSPPACGPGDRRRDQSRGFFFFKKTSLFSNASNRDRSEVKRASNPSKKGKDEQNERKVFVGFGAWTRKEAKSGSEAEGTTNAGT